MRKKRKEGEGNEKVKRLRMRWRLEKTGRLGGESPEGRWRNIFISCPSQALAHESFGYEGIKMTHWQEGPGALGRSLVMASLIFGLWRRPRPIKFLLSGPAISHQSQSTELKIVHTTIS
jgi:hypothetical protein